MIPNPIRKVLSTTRAHQVRALLMGGQACVLYGATQFSRDVDLAIHADAENLDRLRATMVELQAEVIAVPPFDRGFLERGHAVHFRCQHPEARGLRVDVMSRLRGVAPFTELWDRRTTVTDDSDFQWEVLGLADLVQAKKTQRDKDWPMIRSLVEASYFSRSESAPPATVQFWLRELRTPELLIAIARQDREAATRLTTVRPLLAAALAGDSRRIALELSGEEMRERELDAEYWRPLKAELEQLRHRPPSSES